MPTDCAIAEKLIALAFVAMLLGVGGVGGWLWRGG